MWELYALLLGQHRFDRFTLNQIKRDEQIEYVLVGHFCDPDSVQHQFLLARWGAGLKSLQTLLAAKAEAEAVQEAEAMAETLRRQDSERREARRVWHTWSLEWPLDKWFRVCFGVMGFAVVAGGGFVYWAYARPVTPAPRTRVNDTITRILEPTMQMVTSLLPHIAIVVVAVALLFVIMRGRY